MDTESKLQSLVFRVEQSSVSEDEKNEIYASLHAAFDLVTTPVLVSHMSDEQLTLLKNSPNPEGFIGIVRYAIDDGNVLSQIDTLIQRVLDNTEQILIIRNIIH